MDMEKQTECRVIYECEYDACGRIHSEKFGGLPQRWIWKNRLSVVLSINVNMMHMWGGKTCRVESRGI